MLLHNRYTTPRSLPHTSCMLFLAPARRSLGVQFPWLIFKAVFDSLISRFLRELKVPQTYSCMFAPPRRGHCRILPVCSSSHLLGVPLGFNSRDLKKKLSLTAWLRFLRELKVTQTYFLYVCSTTPQSLSQTSCLLFLAPARRSLGVQFPWLNNKSCLRQLDFGSYGNWRLHKHTSCMFVPPRRGHFRRPPVCSSSHLLGVPLGFNSRD